MDTSPDISKGPRRYRVGIFLLAVLLGVLLVWVGRFVFSDLDTLPQPVLPDPTLEARQAELQQRVEALQRDISVEEEREGYLRESTSSSQQTLTQLLELRREDAAATPTAEEDRMFAESQALFLRNQEQVQEVMERILSLRAEMRTVQDELSEVGREIGEIMQPLYERRRHKIALFKFVFLAPFVLLGIWIFRKTRRSPYRPFSYAFNGAVLYLLLSAIHEHFPREYYKYMFVGLAIVAVGWTLVYLIRLMTRPGGAYLLKQRREAYTNGQCPVCSYAITADVMRTHTAIVGKKAAAGGVADAVVPREYSCPSCGTSLFVKCDECEKLRHALLPYCSHCGTETAVGSASN